VPLRYDTQLAFQAKTATPKYQRGPCVNGVLDTNPNEKKGSNSPLFGYSRASFTCVRH
jgi:hypothetical protein